jgi:hypothetical protein
LIVSVLKWKTAIVYLNENPELGNHAFLVNNDVVHFDGLVRGALMRRHNSYAINITEHPLHFPHHRQLWGLDYVIRFAEQMYIHESTTNSLFAACDSDQNNIISWEEFIEIAKANVTTKVLLMGAGKLNIN